MRPLRIATAIPILLVCGAVSAADFTFNVPVRIENSIIWTIYVSCYVIENEIDSAGSNVDGVTRLIGDGSTRVELTDGEFDGIVTVEVDADAGRYPALARAYRCNLRATWPFDPEVGYLPGGGGVAASPDNFRRVYEERGGRVLETLENKVYGRIEQ